MLPATFARDLGFSIMSKVRMFPALGTGVGKHVFMAMFCFVFFSPSTCCIVEKYFASFSFCERGRSLNKLLLRLKEEMGDIGADLCGHCRLLPHCPFPTFDQLRPRNLKAT